MSILVIAEHDNNAIKPGLTNAVACAQKIGGDIHVLVAGSNCATAASACAAISGVSKVLVADAPHYLVRVYIAVSVVVGVLHWCFSPCLYRRAYTGALSVSSSIVE